jgi:hypothetical protein
MIKRDSDATKSDSHRIVYCLEQAGTVRLLTIGFITPDVCHVIIVLFD